MSVVSDPSQPHWIAGLCRTCSHARTISSDRGSTFLQCQLALTDSRFPKYPRLPVLACDGYVKIEDTPAQ